MQEEKPAGNSPAALRRLDLLDLTCKAIGGPNLSTSVNSWPIRSATGPGMGFQPFSVALPAKPFW